MTINQIYLVSFPLLTRWVGSAVTLAFAFIDGYSKYFVDNLENTIIPGILMYALIWFFILY